MKLIDCANALKECGPGATISIAVPGRHTIVMKLLGDDLSVSHDQKEHYRVTFKGDKVSFQALGATRDACADCLQKCYDKCGGTALCVDKCSQGCPC